MARPVTVCAQTGGTPPTMSKSLSVALYVLVLTIVVVGVDLMFFRNRFLERLIANIGIVLVFAAFYLRFFRDS
jgi:type IV secretory pathway VirB2 component (pilin)